MQGPLLHGLFLLMYQFFETIINTISVLDRRVLSLKGTKDTKVWALSTAQCHKARKKEKPKLEAGSADLGTLNRLIYCIIPDSFSLLFPLPSP